jgi:hypothetical protein
MEGQTFGNPSDAYYKDAWRFSWRKFLPQAEGDVQTASHAHPDAKANGTH